MRKEERTGDGRPGAGVRKKEKQERRFYTSGEFARKAQVTLRMVRYYDQKGLLHPSERTGSGARLYTDEDFARLQQILLFRYLGFSLEEIRELTLSWQDTSFLLQSLRIQKKLLEERSEQVRTMIGTVQETIALIEQKQSIDYSAMLRLIHLTSMEDTIRTQYANATNISARISLHTRYSRNPVGWFPWIFSELPLREGMRVLEVGCGNGELWREAKTRLPQGVEITLSDISEGMVRDAEGAIGEDERFSYRVFDAAQIPFADGSFDLVVANHMLFYCRDLDRVLSECCRVLTPEGCFVCSTYSGRHMREITQLVQDFNPAITLSADTLYERFGLDNGQQILERVFAQVQCRLYDDYIELDDPEPLIAYILSCHGNQNRLLLDHYAAFREFVSERVQGGFRITKDAGIFVCRKQQAEESGE